ncbi:MAG TPA: AbrB/MazE/SpoVT family DNA-binding domain-containing protein [Anaerolineae bacterium]|nr:AbrB/MazE/SpoVT family DNA-binding domain-containing protein [Anaerolineae bacterium]
MSAMIKTRIIKIGNSQGVRIPKLLLDQVDLGEEVELALEENQIVIRPSRLVRYNWAEQFALMAEKGDDYLLEDTLVTTEWDETEWEW